VKTAKAAKTAEVSLLRITFAFFAIFPVIVG